MDWKIYYDDGTTFNSNEGTPQDAPIYGVICIVQPDDEVGRTIIHRWDYYAFIDVEWMGHHYDGFILENLFHVDKIQSWIAGRVIETKDYYAILKRAYEDEGFPKKSAKKSFESGIERVD